MLETRRALEDHDGMSVDLHSLPAAPWAAGLAARLDAALNAARDRPGKPVLFAAAGGSTPTPVLEALALRAPAWAEIRVTATDERLTDIAEARNLAMIARALPGASILDLAALATDARPDVVLLGFGADRHVASAFPAGEGMAAARRLDPDAPTIVRATPDPLPAEAPFSRLTFTLGALAHAPALFIAAKGAAKRGVFAAAQAEDPPASPLALLLSTRTRLGLKTEAWFAEDA
jgi:6-phosphogluconolactonase